MGSPNLQKSWGLIFFLVAFCQAEYLQDYIQEPKKETPPHLVWFGGFERHFQTKFTPSAELGYTFRFQENHLFGVLGAAGGLTKELAISYAYSIQPDLVNQLSEDYFGLMFGQIWFEAARFDCDFGVDCKDEVVGAPMISLVYGRHYLPYENFNWGIGMRIQMGYVYSDRFSTKGFLDQDRYGHIVLSVHMNLIRIGVSE